MRVSFAVSVLAAALVATAVPSVRGSAVPSSTSQCQRNEFYYMECCLPQGGPQRPPSPPYVCCPSNWYWSSKYDCCMPRTLPRQDREPECPRGWKWNDDDCACRKQRDACSKDDFWWEQTTCCLPHGGPSHPPTPPSNANCPSTWYWHSSHKCCVPRHPDAPCPPTCPPGSQWHQPSWSCQPGQPPQPSHRPRAKKARTVQQDRLVTGAFCPPTYTACPVLLNGTLTDELECVHTSSELRSCGGCLSASGSTARGLDCTTIPHVVKGGATCHDGVCVGKQGRVVARRHLSDRPRCSVRMRERVHSRR
ncbi:hypothetical protein EXIGLDRAFT_623437 [Exidia glandulosa HHB12029]|uniref:Protein CPL1-like domain-containing protein n=1 Tax=Exidia glandulosa HHB12029 TaxID=1314781 RepID=A0A165DQ96_EXIGL|nr:hypothetical protein EXIGLDRAFT_623437 [Exidia glandulosa HHB12029]